MPGVQNIVPDALSRRPDHNLALRRMDLLPDDWLQGVKAAYEDDEFAKKMILFLRDHETPTASKVRQQASNFEFNGEYLLWKGTDFTRLYVANSGTLRLNVIERFQCPAHFATDKTYPKLSRHVYWPGMYADTDHFCSRCHDCQVNKVPNTAPAGMLQPHDVPETVWDTITMEFITELPKGKAGYDSVFVIVEKLSKRAVFILTTKTVTSMEAAQLLHDSVFNKFEMPFKIVSDRDPKLKSNFWTTLAQLLNIKLNISTADHPQTEGQSEVMIRTLSKMIRKTMQEEKDSWNDVLSTLEFEYNASRNASIGLSPFEIDIGRIPHNMKTRKLEECGVRCQSAADMVDRMNDFRIMAKDNLAEAQARQRHYADIKRRDVSYNMDDLVLLRNDNLSVSSRSNLPTKWQPKYLGPLRVIEVMRPVNYRVEIPPSMKRARSVFHVSKLKLYKEHLGRKGPLSVVVDADATVEQEVKAILKKKREKRRIYYLVQFMDEPD